ncbi:MAG TPA: divergent PAP2 family protein [Patescibacteria group bacterium]|nr:divergent PAP2 family protein [Patescibacteria group bacterium]
MTQHVLILFIPIIVVIITQMVKIALEFPQHGLQWKRFNSYGGMPSAHTAGLVSLDLVVGLLAGFTSPLFAVTTFIALVFIRDAIGIRWSLGFHAKVLNRLIHTLPEEERQHLKLPNHLEERLGHRMIEVIIGALFGIICTFLLYGLLILLF